MHGLKHISVIAAGRHSAAVDHQGRLFVWGPAFCPKGKALVATEPHEVQLTKPCDQISIGQQMSSYVSGGRVYTWGLTNRVGQLGNYNGEPNGLPEVVRDISDRVAT